MARQNGRDVKPETSVEQPEGEKGATLYIVLFVSYHPLPSLHQLYYQRRNIST